MRRLRQPLAIVAAAVAALAGTFAVLAVLAAGAGAQPNSDQIYIGANIEPGLWVGGSAQTSLSASSPTSGGAFSDFNNARNAGNTTYGNTIFSCPADASGNPLYGCVDQSNPSYQWATGMYELEFDPSIPGGLPYGDTLTMRAPAGTSFPKDPNDYVVITDCSPQVNIGIIETGLAACTGAASVVGYVGLKVTVSQSGNEVTVPMPLSIPDYDTSSPIGPYGAALFIAGVRNPPEGSYSNLDYSVVSQTQPSVPGYPADGTGQQIFNASSAVADNSTLEPSMARTQVSTTSGDSLTATIRDQYGNGVPNDSVFILPIEGSPTGQFSSGSQGCSQCTQADGTESTVFTDTAAEVAQFEALDNTSGFVIPQEPTVVFTPGPPDPAHSDVTVSPAAVTADGQSYATVTVDLADQFGNPAVQPDSAGCTGGQCLLGDTGTGDQVYLEPQPMTINGNTVFPFAKGTVTPVGGSGCSSELVPAAACTDAVVCPTLEQSGQGCKQRAGQVQFDIADPTAEEVDFDVQDLTTPGTPLPVISSSCDPWTSGGNCPAQAVDFTAGAPVAVKSTITAAPSTVRAGSSSKVTVTLEDEKGNPVPNIPVTLQQGAGTHATITAVNSTTNNSGQAVFSVSDATEEGVSLSAAYGGCASSCTTPANATVTFISSGTDAANSTVVASPTSLLADGKQASTITVTLLDIDGNPVVGEDVSLSQPASAHSTIATVDGTTNASGKALFSVTDATPENVTYTATDTSASPTVTLTQQATVSFTPAPDVGKSTVTASPGSVPADGSTTATITVTLLDASGHPIAGKQVCLTGANGPGACSPGSGTSVASAVQIPDATSGCSQQALAGATDCNGQAQFTVSDTAVESVTYGVIDETDYPTGPALGPHATVTFTQPTSEAGNSTISANPTKVLANTPGASGTSTVTVTLLSATGTPLGGHSVSLAQTAGASSQITAAQIPDSASGCGSQAPAGTTDCNGQAAFTVTDAAAESVTYRATDETETLTVDQTATVQFIPNEATLSTVTASSPTATANGGSDAGGTDYVTVTLDPGQPLSGDQVALSQSAGAGSQITAVQIPDSTSGCSTQAPAGSSDCNGQARFEVTDTNLEKVTYTATDSSTGVEIQQTASVTFLPPAPQIASLSPTSGPLAGGTKVTITGTNLYVEGQLPTIAFGSAQASGVSCASSTTCTAIAPAGSAAGPVHVVVTTVAGPSTPEASGDDLYTYVAPLPTVSALSPNHGPAKGGTTVTVTGTHFGTTANTKVHFGTATVTPISVNGAGTQLTVVSPAEVVGIVDVTVTTPGGTSAKVPADRYSYQPNPPSPRLGPRY